MRQERNLSQVARNEEACNRPGGHTGHNLVYEAAAMILCPSHFRVFPQDNERVCLPTRARSPSSLTVLVAIRHFVIVWHFSVSGRRNVGRKERFATWKLDTGVCGQGKGEGGGGGMD